MKHYSDSKRAWKARGRKYLSGGTFEAEGITGEVVEVGFGRTAEGRVDTTRLILCIRNERGVEAWAEARQVKQVA